MKRAALHPSIPPIRMRQATPARPAVSALSSIRSLLPILAFLTLLAVAAPARAEGSWQVRTFPQGSALRVEESVSRGSLILFGRFSGGTVWETPNAGISGSLHGPFPPFPADSIVSAAPGGELLIAQGSIWGKTSLGSWSPIAVPDSAGIPTAAAGEDTESFWFGSERGEIFAVTRAQADEWTFARIGRLGEAAVRAIDRRGGSRLTVLLGDGRFFAQDTAWVESEVRFSAVDFSDAATCYGIESGSARIWRSTDAGLAWEAWSDGLVDARFALHLSSMRRFRASAGGILLIACGDALLVSGDAGRTWRIAATGRGMFEDACTVEEFGAIVTAGARVQSSLDVGYSFEQLMGSDFGDVTPGSRSAFWAIDRGLLLSLDEGKRWFRQPLPEPGDRLTHLLARGEYEIWLHFDSPEGARTLFSTDRGNRYEDVDAEGLLRGMRGWAALEEGPAWAWTADQALRSSDGGRRWFPVREDANDIAAFAARDSMRAAFIDGDRFYSTTDGGAHWSESAAPSGGGRALAAAPGGEWLAAGSGIHLSQPGGGWIRVFEIDPSDTLHSIALVAGGTGWAVGSSGMIAGTMDGGASWEPYRLSLEVASVDTLLAHVRLLEVDRGVTGAGSRLIRLLPDASGPVFRMGVSANPYLPSHLDIHVTAHERLQGDSLGVAIDDEPLDAEMFDPAGYLFRCRTVLEGNEGERILRVSGRDWLGNWRLDSRPLIYARIGSSGERTIRWGAGRVLVRGEAGAPVVLLALDAEAPPLPGEWAAAGSPFQIAAAGALRLEADLESGSIATLQGGTWVESGSSLTAADGAIVALLDAPGEIESIAADRPSLRVFPAPGPGPFRIVWEREAIGSVRWEICDVSGRRVCEGSAPAGTLSWNWNGEDSARRPIPAGVYWLRATLLDGSKSGAERGANRGSAVARILITR